jgi:hypothetical protein
VPTIGIAHTKVGVTLINLICHLNPIGVLLRNKAFGFECISATDMVVAWKCVKKASKGIN